MATTSVKKAVGNYVDSIFYGVSDSNGYLNGATETPPAAGNADGSAMAQLIGVQNFPFRPSAPDMPSQKGDGGVIARFINKPTELPNSELAFGAFDFDFEALIQSLKVLTLGGGRFIGVQPYDPSFRDIMFLATSPAKSQETATLDAGLWEGLFVLKAQVAPQGRDAFKTDALGVYGYQMVANYAGAFPWGHAFTEVDEGDVKFNAVRFTWPYRPIVQRWTGNNVLTTFNLAYAIAEDSSDNIVVFVDGVASTWVAGAPAAGQFGITAGTPDTLVFGTAPGSNAKVVALYGRT